MLCRCWAKPQVGFCCQGPRFVGLPLPRCSKRHSPTPNPAFTKSRADPITPTHFPRHPLHMPGGVQCCGKHPCTDPSRMQAGTTCFPLPLSCHTRHPAPTNQMLDGKQASDLPHLHACQGLMNGPVSQTHHSSPKQPTRPLLHRPAKPKHGPASPRSGAGLLNSPAYAKPQAQPRHTHPLLPKAKPSATLMPQPNQPAAALRPSCTIGCLY
mmetsp:Transcript_8432/g.21070  ORF Transcript_8432/g.21070 Transcript_8432/m.21070 type:complete len:211 (-) Transcript_8432:2292-2924(-)